MFRFIITLSGLFWLFFSAVGWALTDVHSERHRLHADQVIQPLSDKLPDYNHSVMAAKYADYGDLKISETVSPATFTQKNSSIAVLNDGKFVMVWQDNRDGYFKIYGQAFDSSGVEIGANVQLIGHSYGYNSIEPKAVSNGAGGFYLGWRDQATGKICVAGYDEDLNQYLTSFVVNDIPVGNFSGPFDIDSYGSQYIAVVYEDHGLTTDISLRIFSSAGTAFTDPITINSDASSANHWSPSVAFDNLGGMAVAWEDYRNGNADIYFQLVNANGTLSGSNIGIVEALYDDSAQYLPQTAFSIRDGYAISWLDNRGATQDVYLQRYVPASGLSGGNIKISGDDPDYNDWNIDLDINSIGDLNMVWSSSNAESNILLQRFDDGFIIAGLRDTVSCCQTSVQKIETDVAVGISDKIIASWTDDRNGHKDIYAQYLSSSGISLLSGDIIGNDDLEGAESIDPQIAIIDATQSVIVFTDKRNDVGDIYMQIVSSAGSLTGSNILVNTDHSDVLQNEPSLSVSDTKILTAWNDSRSVLGTTGQRIFGKFFDHSGSALSGEFVISDSSNINVKWTPQCAMLSDGTALVVWKEMAGANSLIVGRLLNPDGSFLSAIFTISDDIDDLGNDDVSIEISPSNNFVIGWIARNASGGPKTIVARYNSSGGFMNRFAYTSSVGGADVSDMAFALDNSERVNILWEGSDSKLYFNRFSSTGTVDIDGSLIEESSTIAFEPAITIDASDNMSICYIKMFGDIRRLYYQIFNTNLNAFLKTFVSSNVSPFMSSPSIDVISSDLYFAWTDSRSTGLNIYSSSVSYTPTDIDDENIIVPNGFTLEQNYPNPFNPSTTIQFSLPNRGAVDLSVYNILGEKVATILNRELNAGTHSVVWNGTDDNKQTVGSGIYFYRIKCGEFEHSRKMILLK